MAYVEKRITFDHERDSDIIVYLDSMTSHKSNQLIRQLLRDYIKNERHSQLDRIESKINKISNDIERVKFENLSFGATDGGDNGDQDVLNEITANLEKIGI